MAKQTFWQKLGNLLRGGSSKKASPPKPRQNRDARSETISSRTYTSPRRALLDITKGNDKEERRVKSMAEATKSKPKDTVKELKESLNNAKKMLDEDREKSGKVAANAPMKALEKKMKSFNEATGNRYNVSGAKDNAERLKRRQAQKSQAFDADAAIYDIGAHPIANSFARGAASGATFGATDLISARGLSGRAKEVEDYYQAHKNQTAETVGEIAGSLASFGITGGMTDSLGEAAIKKIAPNAAERLAETGAVKGLAKRGVDKAVKRGLIREELATEAGGELIKNVGIKKADQIVKALGTDIVQNLTTGAVYDINKASAQYEVGSADWWKELGKSAALNFAITGGIAGVSALKGGKRLAAEEMGNLAESVASRRAAREAGRQFGEEAAQRAAAREALTPLVSEADEAAETIAKAEPQRTEEEIVRERFRNDPRMADYTRYDNLAAERDRLIESMPDANNPDPAVLRRLDEIADEMERIEKAHGDWLDNDRMLAADEIRQEIVDEMIADSQRNIPHKGTREAAENLAPKETFAGDFAMVDDEIPVENINETRLNDTRAEAEARAKQVMEEPPRAKESNGAAKSAGEAAEEASEREFTQGQKDAREAFYEKTGTNPETGKAATDDQILEGMGRYHRSQGTSAERKLSRVAMSQIGVSSEEAAEKLLKMQDEGAFGYDVIHHKDMYKEVADDLANDPDRWIDKLCDVAENDEWNGKETPKLLYMAQYLSEITDASKSPEQDALATMAYKTIQKLSTTSAQTLNGRRAYASLSKAGKYECALDDMVSVLDSAIGFNKQHRQAMQGLNKYERQHYIKSQLLKDEKLKECLKKLANAKTDDAISEAYTEMFYQFNKSNPKSGFDIVQEIRYLNMLGNPKTHIRNMFGSGFFAPMRQISNALRSAMEDRIAKEAGLEITKHGGISFEAAAEAWAKQPKTEAGKAALDAFESRKKDILGSMKYDTPQYAGRAKTAAGKLLDKVSDFNSNLLAKEDDFFKSRAFKENYIKSYNKYLKDGVPITDKIKKQIEEEAIQEAQIATFNEYNEFAKWLSNITRKANDANASPLARWGARGVNAVMPFTKVPANLMKQSINYSPIGIAKGMMNIKQAAKKGDAVLLNRAIDELASGLTGTGIFGLGMLLGKTTDMFTTNAGKNDPAAKFKKDRGMQNYSVTFKDPETGKGYSFTLDWLVPSSATFFSGVEFANQLKSGDFNVFDIGGDWSNIVTRLAEPVMETSMLSGLHGMLETMRSGSNDDDTKSAIGILGRETVQSYMNSLLPTMLGQVARTKYKSDLQITGDTDWEYWRNQMKSKAGLGETNIFGEELGADTDAYGNVKGLKNNAGDYVKSGLKNFLSPANIQKVDFSEVDNEKLRTYEEAVKNGADPNDMAYLFPKKQYKKQFKVAGEDVKMSNKDLSTYNQAKTTGGEEGMRYILENIMFNRYDYDSKGNKVPKDSAYTKAEKEALMKQFAGKSMREVEEWLYAQPEFKSASKAEQKKAIEGLWNLSKDTKAVASQRVGEQAVYKAQGKDVNEYNYKNEITESKREALQAAIDSGLITYEEAVDFARNGGKVSYSEDEDGGGSATTYYTKAAMIDYFVEHGIPYDKAEALYNAFKSKNTKPYSGNGKTSSKSGSGSGYRSGGRRRSGGGSRKVKAPASKSMAAATKKSKGTTVKLEPPTPKTTKVTTKFKKYEV